MSDEFSSAADAAMEHAAADAAAGLANAKPSHVGETCLNCGAALAGDFCQDCGQSAGSIRQPFWTLVSESLETFFSIDGRIARTLPDLLLHPGRMTRAYLDGQRTRFIPPFRLYVLASLFFFVLMPLVTGQGFNLGGGGAETMDEARAEVERAYENQEISEAEYREAIDGLNQVEALWTGGVPGLLAGPPPPGPGAPGESAAEPVADAAEPPDPDQEWAGFIPQEALDAIREKGEAGDEDAARFAKAMAEPRVMEAKVREWIPRVMFVLLPIYALLLAVTYLWRRKFLFFDHLIVSLHFHSALFFAMSLGILAAMLIGYGWVWLALLLYSNWYLYRLHRVVYARGAVSSVIRTLTLDAVYFVAILSALLAAAILGAVSI